MKISVLIPTRGRPHSMREVVESAFETVSDKSLLDVVFYMDNDDIESIQAASTFNRSKYNVSYIVNGKIIMSQMWNECCKYCNGEIVMYCGDDVRFRTKNWDLQITKAFEKHKDRIMLVYGRDGIHDQVLPTHAFVHKNWVKAVGYLLPPYFVSDNVDVWMMEVAKKLKRLVYLPDLFFEHLHFSVGKSKKDKTAIARLERAKAVKTDVYKEKEPQRKEDIKKLLKVMS